MSTARIETEDGTVEVEVDDFIDASETIPIMIDGTVEPGPALLRIVAEVQYQTCERIAQAFEMAAAEAAAKGEKKLLMAPGCAAAVARSLAWAMP
jgi:hypothetical protein